MPAGIDKLIKDVVMGFSRICTNLCLPVCAGFIATNQPGERTGKIAAAEACQVIFDRAQLRERYAVSSSLIDRLDGSRSSTDDANVSM